MEEYSLPSTLVQTISVPSAGGSALTNSGSASSEGFINLSANRRYLLVGGYRAAPATVLVATSTSALNPRVIGRLALNGAIDTSTVVGTSFSGGNIRAVTSNDGGQY